MLFVGVLSDFSCLPEGIRVGFIFWINAVPRMIVCEILLGVATGSTGNKFFHGTNFSGDEDVRFPAILAFAVRICL